MSKICLCLTAETLDENRHFVDEYRSSTDILELRVDCLRPDQWEMVPGALKRWELPVILTCRREADGGFFTPEQEKERQDLLWSLLDAPFAYVDLEKDLTDEKWIEKCRDKQILPIRSLHDFNGVPEDLEAFIGKAHPGEIFKAAVTIDQAEDYKVLLKILQKGLPEDTILLAMGATGFFTRVLAPVLGSWLCYCSPSTGIAAAPGHIDPLELCQRYRFRSLDRETPIMGIIGNPLGHSKSPQIHNNWLKEGEIPGVYIAFPLPEIHLLEPLRNLLDLRGLSVTIPYKVDVLEYVDEASSRVNTIGACNTLYKKEDRWMGENTDAPGFLKPLLDQLGCTDLLGRKITVIGAGGASRGIVYALKEAGAELLILNRTESKAQQLAEEFDQKWGPLSENALGVMEEYRMIIVQTTDAGMHPHIEKDPLEFYSFRGDELLYDIVFNPEITRVMERARKAGASILGGYPMLVEQARLQFKLFTGKESSR